MFLRVFRRKIAGKLPRYLHRGPQSILWHIVVALHQGNTGITMEEDIKLVRKMDNSYMRDEITMIAVISFESPCLR